MYIELPALLSSGPFTWEDRNANMHGSCLFLTPALLAFKRIWLHNVVLIVQYMHESVSSILSLLINKVIVIVHLLLPLGSYIFSPHYFILLIINNKNPNLPICIPFNFEKISMWSISLELWIILIPMWYTTLYVYVNNWNIIIIASKSYLWGACWRRYKECCYCHVGLESQNIWSSSPPSCIF